MPLNIVLTDNINNQQFKAIHCFQKILIFNIDYTQPVGFGKPANLQEPFAGPDGNNS